jgi:hypothetical protein
MLRIGAHAPERDRVAGWRDMEAETRMKVVQVERSLRTKAGLEVRDITEEVREAVAESGVSDGIACVYSPTRRASSG